MSPEIPVAAGSRIAFFGPLTLLAREIRKALEESALRVSDVKLYDTEAEGALEEFAGEALVVTRPDEEAILNLDIAFMCGTAGRTTSYLDWAGRRGFVAIDLSGAARDRPGVPLVHTEINPDAIRSQTSAGGPTPIIAAPHGISHNLATIVSAARDVARLEGVSVLGLRPAGDLGEEGIDELYRQTVGLLNFSAVPQEVFARQVAFNVVPSIGVTRSRAEGFEERIRTETCRLVDLAPDRFAVSTAFVPVFHGHALLVTLSFDAPVQGTALREVFQSRRDLRVVEDPGAFSAVDLAGEKALFVLVQGSGETGTRHVSVWCFCDNLKGGAALNAVRIAQRVADLRRGAAG